MPTLTKNCLNLLQDDYAKYSCFIETGTHEGATIFEMEPYFNKLYTIEISAKYYTNTKNRYTGNKIKFIYGDSTIMLNSLLPQVNEKCIFFLDGHWSSGDTGKGDKDCPLLEEIAIINTLYTNEAIIIIDDCNLFGLDASSGVINEDWSYVTKEKILDIVLTRTSKAYYIDSIYLKNNRFVIHLNAK